jgi:hypothetical protein
LTPAIGTDFIGTGFPGKGVVNNFYCQLAKGIITFSKLRKRKMKACRE